MDSPYLISGMPIPSTSRLRACSTFSCSREPVCGQCRRERREKEEEEEEVEVEVEEEEEEEVEEEVEEIEEVEVEEEQYYCIVQLYTRYK